MEKQNLKKKVESGTASFQDRNLYNIIQKKKSKKQKIHLHG